jgi:hypothetical protein
VTNMATSFASSCGTKRATGRRTLSPRARPLLPARPSSPAPEAGQPVISYSKGRPVSRS